MTEMFKMGFNDKLREFDDLEKEHGSNAARAGLGILGTMAGISGAVGLHKPINRIISGLLGAVSGAYTAKKMLDTSETGLRKRKMTMDMTTDELNHIINRRNVLNPDQDKVTVEFIEKESSFTNAKDRLMSKLAKLEWIKPMRKRTAKIMASSKRNMERFKKLKSSVSSTEPRLEEALAALEASVKKRKKKLLEGSTKSKPISLEMVTKKAGIDDAIKATRAAISRSAKAKAKNALPKNLEVFNIMNTGKKAAPKVAPAVAAPKPPTIKAPKPPAVRAPAATPKPQGILDRLGNSAAAKRLERGFKKMRRGILG
jgi:hypothetical protein